MHNWSHPFQVSCKDFVFEFGLWLFRREFQAKTGNERSLSDCRRLSSYSRGGLHHGSGLLENSPRLFQVTLPFREGLRQYVSVCFLSVLSFYFCGCFLLTFFVFLFLCGRVPSCVFKGCLLLLIFGVFAFKPTSFSVQARLMP